MLDWLKATWAKWKVQISIAGGVLVVATAFGTCTFSPAEEVSTTTTVNDAEVVPVNSTTENSNENSNENTNETTNSATNGGNNTTTESDTTNNQ